MSVATRSSVDPARISPLAFGKPRLLCSQSAWRLPWVQCGYDICLRFSAWLQHTLPTRETGYQGLLDTQAMVTAPPYCNSCLGHREAKSHRGTRRRKRKASENPVCALHKRPPQEHQASCSDCTLTNPTFPSVAVSSF